MKKLLTLLCLVAVNASAQYQYKATSFTHSLVSTNVSATGFRSAIEAASSTNAATLTGANTFTGTNVFPAAKFFPANGVAIRKLWSAQTNIYIPFVATNSAATNAGDFATITQLAEVTVPALLSANSAFSMSTTFLRTNATDSATFLYTYVGTNTNFISQLQVGGTTVGVSTEFRPGGVVYWVNNHSFTNQMQAGFGTFYNGPSNFVDTSSDFKVYVGVATAISHSNLQVLDLTMFESVR